MNALEDPNSSKASKTSKRVLWIIAIVLLLIAYPWFYLSLPIQGKVVDSKTGEPLKNVYVIATWPLYANLPYHIDRVGFIQVAEAVTNENGEYRIPGWFRVPLHGSLQSNAPLLYFYKKDYRVSSGGDNRRHAPILIVGSDFDDATVELTSFDGTIQEYAQHLSGTIDFRLGNVRVEGCQILKLTKTIEAMKLQQAEFNRIRTRYRLSSAEYFQGDGPVCNGLWGFIRKLF